MCESFSHLCSYLNKDMPCLALLKSEGAALLFQKTMVIMFHQVILGRLELGNWYFKIACSSNVCFYCGHKTGGHLYRSIKIVNKHSLKLQILFLCANLSAGSGLGVNWKTLTSIGIGYQRSCAASISGSFKPQMDKP